MVELAASSADRAKATFPKILLLTSRYIYFILEKKERQYVLVAHVVAHGIT